MDRPGLDSQGRVPSIKVRRVRKGDLSKVKDVIEHAFGDFFERQLGTRPRQVFGGAQYVHHRWLMEPWGCFVAEEGDGKIVGAALTVLWGTVGLVGPLAVLTSYQNQGIAQQLLAACQGFFEENRATLQGLTSYPNSPKHLMLYQKFGYRPKGLVVITAKTLDRREAALTPNLGKLGVSVRRYSGLEEVRKKAVMLKIRRIANGIWRGMDPAKEVEIVDGLALGDTLLLEKGREVIGFAVYHTPGVSEAPHGSVYVKLLAIDGRHQRIEHLHALLASVEEVGHAGHLQRVVAPCYTYYWAAYQALLERVYRLDFTMLRMKRGKLGDSEDSNGLVLDDWR